MTSIKVLAPTRLPEGKISEAAFQIFTTELEVYLEVDTKYEIFMPDGRYNTWKSQEEFKDRIEELHEVDRLKIENDETLIDRQQKDEQSTWKLKDIRRLLRVFISLIAKCVTENQYLRITRQCTSLHDVYDILRRDYDCSTLTCFRGFLRYDMTRSVWWQRM